MKIKDKKELMKLTSFLTMGDGCVSRNRGKGNCHFSLNMTEEHLDFVLWAKGIIENITSCKIYLQKKEWPQKNQYKLYTPVHPYFNNLRDRIYVGKYKSIDQHALKLLDFQALSILYMCDGCLRKYTNQKTGSLGLTTTINMCRLSYGDQLLLKKAIKERLDVEFNIVKTNSRYYALRLRSKDHNKFMEGISPYIFDSFLYKVDFRTIGP